MRHYCSRVVKLSAIRCPGCGCANPPNASKCSHCQGDITVRVAVNTVTNPIKRGWENVIPNVTPQTKRQIQWTYLILSAAILWWLLAYVEQNGGDSWPTRMALSIIYVALLAFFGVWLIPRRVFQVISRRATRLVKLALALNGLSAMIVLQLFINAWWARALILAGMFLVAWLATFVLNYILAAAAQTEDIFLGSRQQEFDASSPQGRSARLD